ncbi:hypothetical protein DMN91_003094 [Ooceraea biroi]|uniref:Vacuolar ATPase assembly integral membrane protein VMA21 homolog n=1 Tax=Ooceraea biroi TaxID=2015173 RepID=A0A3L8DXI3_OOCBI|nr:hypothetical protein DMN91_003094 [Ooceraea biroi]
MVLIIRNCRILSRRQNKEARVKNLQDYQRSCRQELICENKDTCAMDSQVTVLGILFLYSIAMFTLPFVAFFGTQHLVSAKFHTDHFVTNCVSVLAAVVTVNLIISCYAYQALHESIQEKEQSEDEVRVESKESLNKKID